MRSGRKWRATPNRRSYARRPLSFNRASDQLSRIRQEIIRIERHPDMTPSQKRERIEQQRDERIAVARGALGTDE